jgi:hypothetical protein
LRKIAGGGRKKLFCLGQRCSLLCEFPHHVPAFMFNQGVPGLSDIEPNCSQLAVMAIGLFSAEMRFFHEERGSGHFTYNTVDSIALQSSNLE